MSPEEHDKPVIKNNRKIVPETGEVRAEQDQVEADEASTISAEPGQQETTASGVESEHTEQQVELALAQQQAAEYLADVQRLQAEYANYRRRADKQRNEAEEVATAKVVEALIPLLDDYDSAQAHGELTGPYGQAAEKLQDILTRFGWEKFGAAGEVFDPQVHEALLNQETDEVQEPVVAQVLRSGHKVGDRIIRAAQVAVNSPK